MNDMVHQPPHYTGHPSGVECIEITRVMGFVLGNAFKYTWRYRLKNSILEDLDKAVFYLNYHLEHTPILADYDVWGRAKRRRLAASVPFDRVRSADPHNWPLIYIFDGWRLHSRKLLALAVDALQDVRIEAARELQYEQAHRNTTRSSSTGGVLEK